MDYLKRESALILNQTCVTFYFLVRNLTSLKNTNTINTSFSLCKDFYVEHRGCTEWLKLINQLILLKLTLLLEKSKMAKILKILKISKIFKNYHLEPFHIVAHLCNTLFIILCFPQTIVSRHQRISPVLKAPLLIPTVPLYIHLYALCGFVASVCYAICSCLSSYCWITFNLIKYQTSDSTSDSKCFAELKFHFFKHLTHPSHSDSHKLCNM